MKIAHLILAHKNPEQLARLVDRLSHRDADVYIHLDAKTNIKAFGGVVTRPHVFFVKKRVKVYWGAYSIVQATLNGLAQILTSGKSYQYINLLSGDDYPIKHVNYIHNFFTANRDKIFMEYLTQQSAWWAQVKSRVTRYHLTNYRFPGRYMVQWLMNKFLPPRKIPGNMEFVGRSQWFTITPQAAQYVLNEFTNNKKLVSFFKLTWGADEVAIQTVLYNSPFKTSIENNNLRYTDWGANGVSPKTLDISDAASLAKSAALYARKFDMAKHPEILDQIDKIH